MTRLLLILSTIFLAFTAGAKDSELSYIQRLGDPLDTMHNERLYLSAIEQALTHDNIPKGEKMRLEIMAQSARKNAEGTPAADITFITPDNAEHHLTDYRGRLTLIFFNDPDCESCSLVKKRIADSAELSTLVRDKKLIIVGIYPFDDEELWRETEYPTHIVNGWDKNHEIDGNETYELPHFPIFYLLSPDGIVITKNEPSLRRIISRIAAITAE